LTRGFSTIRRWSREYPYPEWEVAGLIEFVTARKRAQLRLENDLREIEVIRERLQDRGVIDGSEAEIREFPPAEDARRREIACTSVPRSHSSAGCGGGCPMVRAVSPRSRGARM
jgi:hypothetical protein